MAQNNFDDVGDFHEKFDLDNVTHRGAGLRMMPPDLMNFRIKFLHEELKEFEDAWVDGDVPKMFDALLDLVYVAMGTAHLLGLPWQRGWDEVQRANMTKVRATADGSDSKRSSPWDVVKPPGWTPPDLDTVINGLCPRCNRRIIDGDIREIIVDRLGLQFVEVHCACGHRLAERPA